MLPAKTSSPLSRVSFTQLPWLADMMGGLASMLVAFPSAIAFGLLAGYGAMAGILGAIALGIVAPLFGGAPRLVSAPCAPAAAVLGAFVATLGAQSRGLQPEFLPLVLVVITVAAGLIQFVFGLLGGGKLIKFIPYPVVAGYLSGVGILIIVGQLPKVVGANLLEPSGWSIPSLVVGLVSMGAMLLAPKITRAIPGAIVALTAGVAAYFLLSLGRPELAVLEGNSLVLGPVAGPSGTGAADGVISWIALLARHGAEFTNFLGNNLSLLAGPIVTLALLLSIDTLKTCVIVDALTRSRHHSNRELIGQGLANMTSGLVGGMPGAGTMGATLVNLSSGGKTRLSGVFAGVFALLAFLALGKFVAWVPVPALAGILLVVGFRMIDRKSFQLLRQRTTALDFLVIAAVVATAVGVGLMPAAGVGVGLAVFLFLREQIRGTVVRRKVFGNQMFSKKKRLLLENAVLEKYGDRTIIVELQGSLFFGTSDQLYTELEPYLSGCDTIILGMRRVQSVDFTAAHMLEVIEAQVEARKGRLVFADLPAALPTGQDLSRYFRELGFVDGLGCIRIFEDLEGALEWAEDRILSEHLSREKADDAPLELGQIQLFAGASEDTLRVLGSCIEERAYQPGQRIFTQGEQGDELFLVRHGGVRISLPLAHGKAFHLATFGTGDFFGDMAFLDQGARSADAVALSECRLYVLSRAAFDRTAAEHRRLGATVFARIAHALALRLRKTDAEVRVLRET